MDVPQPIRHLIEEAYSLEHAGEVGAALQRARQAVELARASGEPAVIAGALISLARARFRLGQYAAARVAAEEALSLTPADTLGGVRAWQVLGNCAGETNSLPEAQSFYTQAADLARELSDVGARVAALHGLAVAVHLPRGQFDLALAAEEEVYRVALEQDIQEAAVPALVSMALIFRLTGRRGRAHAVLDELAQRAIPRSLAHGYQLALAAALALDEGQNESAKALYGEARSIAETSGEPWLNVSVRVGMARVHRLAGDAPSARNWASDAVAFATRVGYRHELGLALIERARAAGLGADPGAAEDDLRSAIVILEELGAAFELAQARLLLAVLLHQEGRHEATAAWAGAAHTLLQGGYAFLLEQERSSAFPLVAAHLNSRDAALARVSAELLAHLRRVPADPLVVRMLGRLSVQQGTRSLSTQVLHRRRGGELLAILLTAPGYCLSSEEVAEALSPEGEPAAAQVLLHHSTSALRRALEPGLPDKFPSRYLEVEEGHVALHLPPGSWVDSEAFEGCYRRREWEEAVALYAGELLADYRYAEWTIAPRERLALLYQRVLLACAEARLAAGRAQEALDACLRLLALEPWQEQAVLLGMRAFIRLNDRAGALRLYANLEKSLREELNTAPQAELQALYRSLTSSRAG